MENYIDNEDEEDLGEEEDLDDYIKKLENNWFFISKIIDCYYNKFYFNENAIIPFFSHFSSSLRSFYHQCFPSCLFIWYFENINNYVDNYYHFLSLLKKSEFFYYITNLFI